MAQASEKLLTTIGFKKLQIEFDYYWKVLRPETVQRIADAAAEGDRSENAEYIYGRKKLREIDKRLQYLGKLLDQPRVIDPCHIKSDKIGFGATVIIRDENGQQKRWTIVGEGEADPSAGTISDQSPVARALKGKRVGDFVMVDLPDREVEYEVIDLEYGGATWQALVVAAQHWRFEPKL